jgi:hypothetical protein
MIEEETDSAQAGDKPYRVRLPPFVSDEDIGLAMPSSM